MARLTYRTPDGSEAQFPLTPGSGEVILGRHPKCPIVLKSPSVSRRHAKVVHENGRYVLYDMGSANGTFMGGQRISRRALSGRQVEFLVGDIPVVYEETADAGGAAPQAAPVGPPVSPGPTAREARAAEPTTTAQPASVPSPEKGRRGERKPRERAPHKPAESGAPAAAAAPAPALGRPGVEKAQEAALRKEVEQREAELAETQTRIGEMKNRIRRKDEELEEASEREKDLKSALAHTERELQKAQAAIADQTASVEEADARTKKLEDAFDDYRKKDAERHEEVSNLKIKLARVEKDHLDAQKAFGHKESEYAELLVEMEELEDRFNEDTGRQSDLERKLNELREVVAEKENHIRDLRQELDDKDYEIRQVKLGVGMSDLEEERHKLLEDFYAANRELQRLRNEREDASSTEKEQKEEVQGLRARVRQLEKKLEAKKDITTHPDYKAKERELERQQAELDDAHGTIIDMTRRLKAVSKEDVDGLKSRVAELEGEVAAAKDTMAAREDELAKARDEASQAGEQLSKERGDQDAMAEENAKLQGELDAARGDLDGARDELDAARNALETAQQAAAAGGDADAARAELAVKNAALEGELEGLRGELTGAQGELDGLKGQLDGLKGQLDEARTAAEAGGGGGALDQAAKTRLLETLDSLDTDAKTLKTYIRDVERSINILAQLGDDVVGDKFAKKLKRYKPTEAIEHVKEALSVLGGDTEDMAKQLNAL